MYNVDDIEININKISLIRYTFLLIVEIHLKLKKL